MKYANRIRAEYEYNGLNWRIIKRADTDLDQVVDQQRTMYYSANWQLLEERIHDYDVQLVGDNRHMQYVWGARYIDDIILHREDNDKDGTYDDTWYHLTDVQFSTVSVINDTADLIERVTYTAYGEARHHYMADVDGDGDVDATEVADIRNTANGLNHAIGQANYNVDQDIDRDGDVTITDYNIARTENTHGALKLGSISDSAVDNQIGYDGYVFNAETKQYHVRHRSYSPTLGRWLERDPAGYVDGMSLYEYADGSPISLRDPSGLFKVFPGVHQSITRVGHGMGAHHLKALALRQVIFANFRTDASVLFSNKDLHATKPGWANVVKTRMAEIKKIDCEKEPFTGPTDLTWAIGTTLHTLQDYYAHTDWVDGNNLIPAYNYHGDTDLVAGAATHNAHWNEQIDLVALENGNASIYRDQVIYFTGGSFGVPGKGVKEFFGSRDLHERYAADQPGFGRSKAPPSGLGFQGFTRAQSNAVKTTKSFIEWAYQNMDPCCRKKLFVD